MKDSDSDTDPKVGGETDSDLGGETDSDLGGETDCDAGGVGQGDAGQDDDGGDGGDGGQKINSEITHLLHSWSEGEPKALEDLMSAVFDELRTTARGYLNRESSGHTLQPTALVNEVYLRLAGRRKVKWDNRLQFFGFAANLMRMILVDHARKNLTAKRGSGQPKIYLGDGIDIPDDQDAYLLALHDALKALEKEDPRQCEIVKLRFFMGLTHEEIAAVLEVSVTTVKREWRTAKLWLLREIRS